MPAALCEGGIMHSDLVGMTHSTMSWVESCAGVTEIAAAGTRIVDDVGREAINGMEDANPVPVVGWLVGRVDDRLVGGAPGRN